MYSQLASGGIVNKEEAAELYDVNVRSIQRDIADIREFVESHTLYSKNINTVIFDRKADGYRLRRPVFRIFSVDDTDGQE